MNLKVISNYLIPVFIRLIDFLTIVLSGYLAIHIKFSNNQIPNNFYYLLIILASLLFILIANKLYNSWRGRSIFQLIFLISSYWFLSQAILLSIIFYSQSGILFSRIWLASWTLISLVMLLLVRLTIFVALRKIRFKGRNHKHIAIVGEGQLSARLLKEIQDQEESGFQIARVVGFADLNEISKLAELNLNEIWITFDINHGDKVHLALEALIKSPATIRIAPDLHTYRLINHNFTEILGYPMIDISSTPLVGVNALIKDLQDITISLVALIFLSPLILLIAIGVKLTSPGPIFYRQERVSLNGSIFNMLKFRSMPHDIEKEKIVWGNSDEKVNHWFGHLLRKSNFDELPQLINVLKGDMSIVGPRPERPMFVGEFKNKIPFYMKKHLVKGGITGWAQVNGFRGDTDLKTRIDYDLFYIENWSFWLDIKIILLTFSKIFKK